MSNCKAKSLNVHTLTYIIKFINNIFAHIYDNFYYKNSYSNEKCLHKQ